MAADNIVNLVINQKSDFEVIFYIQENNAAFNMTGYSAAAKLKTNFQTPDSQAVAFTTNITNAANGTVTIALSRAQTANLAIGKYIYDLTITSPSPDDFKTRVVEGSITISGGVS